MTQPRQPVAQGGTEAGFLGRGDDVDLRLALSELQGLMTRGEKRVRLPMLPAICIFMEGPVKIRPTQA
jgi:hypothetical protein